MTSWVVEWLAQLRQAETQGRLRIDDFILNSVQRNRGDYYWRTEAGPVPELIILADIDLKPSFLINSLWHDDLIQSDTNGWIRHQQLWFVFLANGESFQPILINIYRPFDFEYTFDSADFEGLTDHEIVGELMVRWFDSYTNYNVPFGYQLDGYVIDDIKLEQVDDWGAKYTITFSLQRELFQAKAFAWGNGEFAGHYISDLDPWMHGLLRYVGIRHENQRLIFKSLDRSQPDRLEPDHVVQRSTLAEDTPEELGRVLMARLMTGYIGPEHTSCMKLLDYRINRIEPLDFYGPKPPEVKEDYLIVEVDYSALPYEPSCTDEGACPGWHCEGSGDRSTAWVNGLQAIFYIQVFEDTYEWLYTWNGCCAPPPPPWATPPP